MPELRDVRLVQVPLDVHAKAVQWHEDLMREFTLIGISESRDAGAAVDGADVPARLLALVTELRSEYGPFTDPTTQELERARRRGAIAADVTYRVPTTVGEVAQRFTELLDEADGFCRSGDLLTLAAPPEVASFRRWFLGEFTRQLGGAQPTPWPTWSGSGD